MPRVRHTLVTVKLFDEMDPKRLAKIATGLLDHNGSKLSKKTTKMLAIVSRLSRVRHLGINRYDAYRVGTGPAIEAAGSEVGTPARSSTWRQAVAGRSSMQSG